MKTQINKSLFLFFVFEGTWTAEDTSLVRSVDFFLSSQELHSNIYLKFSFSFGIWTVEKENNISETNKQQK